MKQFECCTLVPGCEWHTRSNETAEVIHCAVEHMRLAHGDTLIRENLVYNIKLRIVDVSEAKAA